MMPTPTAVRGFALAGLLFAAAAQGANASPAARGPQASTAYFDALLQQTFDHYALPGIALGVIEDGRVVYRGTRGETAAGSGDAIDAQTLFKIASNSKAMTTALLARLVDAGRLDWNDPVRKHLPAFRMHDPWVTREIQLRDLLIHNSGLGLGAGDLMLWPEPNRFSRQDVIAGIAHLKPTHSFRSHYAYDNILYIVAGEVAAAAAGAPYSELMRREVFEPLGMTRCQAGAFERDALGKVAQPHIPGDGGHVVVRADPAQIAESTSAAAGGIRCSLDDMLAWAGAWLAPDGTAKDWLSPAQRDAVWTPQMPLPLGAQTRTWEQANFLAYGYGWRLSDAAGTFKVSHTGTLAGMYSVLTLLPGRRTGWVVLINGSGGEARNVLNQLLLDHYTQPARGRDVAWYANALRGAREDAAIAAPPAPAAPRRAARPAQLQARFGVYRDPWFGEMSLCPVRREVRLWSAKSPLMRGRVMRVGDRFLVDWDDASVDAEAWLHFPAADAGTPAGLRLAHVDPEADFSYDYQDLAFERVRDCGQADAR